MMSSVNNSTPALVTAPPPNRERRVSTTPSWRSTASRTSRRSPLVQRIFTQPSSDTAKATTHAIHAEGSPTQPRERVTSIAGLMALGERHDAVKRSFDESESSPASKKGRSNSASASWMGSLSRTASVSGPYATGSLDGTTLQESPLEADTVMQERSVSEPQ